MVLKSVYYVEMSLYLYSVRHTLPNSIWDVTNTDVGVFSI